MTRQGSRVGRLVCVQLGTEYCVCCCWLCFCFEGLLLVWLLLMVEELYSSSLAFFNRRLSCIMCDLLEEVLSSCSICSTSDMVV